MSSDGEDGAPEAPAAAAAVSTEGVTMKDAMRCAKRRLFVAQVLADKLRVWQSRCQHWCQGRAGRLCSCQAPDGAVERAENERGVEPSQQVRTPCATPQIAIRTSSDANVPFFSGLVAATQQEQDEMRRKEVEEKEAQISSDEDNDEDDDEFMRDYRQKRLAELKAEQVQRMRDAYRPTFGTLLTVTADQLADCVDKEHPG